MVISYPTQLHYQNQEINIGTIHRPYQDTEQIDHHRDFCHAVPKSLAHLVFNPYPSSLENTMNTCYKV